MEYCGLCGRKCRGDKRFCIDSQKPVIASALIHFGEEPPLVNRGGSGAVFFSGCSLKCRQCQNEQLSHFGLGRVVDDETLADIFMAVQRAGAQNLNLITGTHFISSIVASLVIAKDKGLSLPVFWNTGTYESSAALDTLMPFVDGFLADLKTLDTDFSKNLCGLPDYPETAKRNLLRMAEQKPLRYKQDELVGGVIVRHLVYPGFLESTRECLEWYSEHLKDKALLSFMAQYTPVRKSEDLPELNRRLSDEEWERCNGFLEEFGIEDGFVQELLDEGDWFPDFAEEKPFPAADCKPVWHFKTGFCAMS